jgi:hypothetical protein
MPRARSATSNGRASGLPNSLVGNPVKSSAQEVGSETVSEVEEIREDSPGVRTPRKRKTMPEARRECFRFAAYCN